MATRRSQPMAGRRVLPGADECGDCLAVCARVPAVLKGQQQRPGEHTHAGEGESILMQVRARASEGRAGRRTAGMTPRY